MDPSARLKSTGFTLVELMIILAVISVMTGMAIPSIISWLPNYRLKAASRILYSNMQRAKLEAIKRNDTVKMTITVAPGAPPCPAGGGGRYVFFVDNGDGGGVLGDNTRNGGEPIISDVTLQDGVCVLASSFAAGSGFGPKGLPAGGIGTITLGHSNLQGRQFPITQSMAGGISVE